MCVKTYGIFHGILCFNVILIAVKQSLTLNSSCFLVVGFAHYLKQAHGIESSKLIIISTKTEA